MNAIAQLSEAIEKGRKEYLKKKSSKFHLSEEIGREAENLLFHGDNEEAMRWLIDEGMAGKLQLIYIDPPFFSNASYDAVVKAGNESFKHIAYDDRWKKGMGDYLEMLTTRLFFMKDLLCESGIIWIHLDWHVAHYVKIIMDYIFGEKNFVNEVIWTYKSGGTGKKHFARKHDTLLVYAKSCNYKFFPMKEKSYNRQFKPYKFKGVDEYEDELGWYTWVNMKDVWNIDMVGRTSSERTGYATQKPEALMERILASCSEEGDLCADFFCGSGTLPLMASKLGRRFIACDEGSLSVETTGRRLTKIGAGFRIFRQSIKEKKSLRIKLEHKCEETVDGMIRVVISIKSLKVTDLGDMVGNKEQGSAEKLLRESPLDFLGSWCIDTHWDGKVFRPDLFIEQEEAGNSCSFAIKKEHSGHNTVMIKVVDIFGNAIFKKVEV